MDGIGTMSTTTLVLRSHFQTAEVYYHNINQCYTSDDSLWDMDVGVVAGDDKVVDEFLDLGGIPDETDERDFATCVGNLDGQNSDDRDHDQGNENYTCNSRVSFGDIELAAPTEDISDLEWVSKIVDDTLSDIPYFQRTTPSIPKALQTLKFPSKPRSIRPKLAHKKHWSSSHLPERIIMSPPVKNRKGRKSRMSQENEVRKCSHCGVSKTPQWRAGPKGPKTLCNACGVRYKSGRLLPEYRPAISPTFMHHVHSNSHRKVLEMRRNKEHTRFWSSNQFG